MNDRSMVVTAAKQEINRLINRYLSGQLNAEVFCDAFYKIYDLELDYNTLTEPEKRAFSALNTVVSRYTDSENDLRTYPGVYFDEVQLTQQISQTAAELMIHP